MTPHNSTGTAGIRAETPELSELRGESRADLMGRLRRMADEVEHLQTEIAAVEAFITEPDPAPPTLSSVQNVRPGAGWTPNPTPQPWLEARPA